MLNRKLHREHRNYLDRIATQASNVFDLTQIPEWLKRNTRNPLDPDLPWNFKGHEYQIDILSDMADEVVARKCSQVGASELWVRLMLGMLGLSKSITIIYVLPTTGFARKFSKGRIDPVIQKSPVLRDLVNREVDSSELKQVGNNFLYIAGSYGQNSAISVPAQGLFQDEVDFCNQTTLTTFNSRLGHNKPGEYYKRSFSTPTVEKFGIDAMYQETSKAHYCIRCPSCKDWVAPNFMDDVEIPGFDGNLYTFEKEDLSNELIRVDDAFIRCPDCHSPIDWETILNPEKRKWVHENPDNSKHGYQILPIDVPEVNPISRTLRQIVEYDRKKDWVNFKVGYPFSDAETSFLREALEKYCRTFSLPRPDDGDETPKAIAARTTFGLDVGKTSWFTVLIHVEGETRCIYAERIRQDGDNYLGKRVMFLMKVFGCVKGVVDAGPDISVSKYLVDNNPEGKVWACYYTRQQKGTLENYKLNEAEGIVTASRTGCFDSMAKKFNSGKSTLTKSQETPTIMKHLAAMKRVDQTNDQGDLISSWISTDDDHYAHSLNYAHIAMDMLISGAGRIVTAPSLPGIRKQRIKTEPDEPDPINDPLRLKIASR